MLDERIRHTMSAGPVLLPLKDPSQGSWVMLCLSLRCSMAREPTAVMGVGCHRTTLHPCTQR